MTGSSSPDAELEALVRELNRQASTSSSASKPDESGHDDQESRGQLKLLLIEAVRRHASDLLLVAGDGDDPGA